MKNNLTIIRGLPGSGKSTLAKLILDHDWRKKHFEADMFFMKNGIYEFDGSKLYQAHQWCQQQVDESLKFGFDVIVANTFTTLKEMKPYIDMANKYDTDINIILMQNQYGSIHDVPKESMDKMKQRFEHDVSSLL